MTQDAWEIALRAFPEDKKHFLEQRYRAHQLPLWREIRKAGKGSIGVLITPAGNRGKELCFGKNRLIIEDEVYASVAAEYALRVGTTIRVLEAMGKAVEESSEPEEKGAKLHRRMSSTAAAPEGDAWERALPTDKEDELAILKKHVLPEKQPLWELLRDAAKGQEGVLIEEIQGGVKFGFGERSISIMGALEACTTIRYISRVVDVMHEEEHSSGPKAEGAEIMHPDFFISDYQFANLREIGQRIHARNRKAGWWDKPRDTGTLLMLAVSELAEAMEGDRKGLMDDHLPERKMLEVELADAVIRILDMGEGLGLDVAGAMKDKLEYNLTRADHQKANREADGGKKY